MVSCSEINNAVNGDLGSRVLDAASDHSNANISSRDIEKVLSNRGASSVVYVYRGC